MKDRGYESNKEDMEREIVRGWSEGKRHLPREYR